MSHNYGAVDRRRFDYNTNENGQHYHRHNQYRYHHRRYHGHSPNNGNIHNNYYRNHRDRHKEQKQLHNEPASASTYRSYRNDTRYRSARSYESYPYGHYSRHANRTYNTRRDPGLSHVISTKHETLVPETKDKPQPFFYDNQSAIAQKVHSIPKVFGASMMDEEEKTNLYHQQQINVIREHQNAMQMQCSYSDDNYPATPSGSDSDEYNTDIHMNSKSDSANRFGPMKDTKALTIWDVTADHALRNQHGVDVLANAEREPFGIYHEKHIIKQAMMIPDTPTIDGAFITKTAHCAKSKTETAKKQTKKTRRGGKNKRRNMEKPLSQMERDQIAAQQLVDYLSMIQSAS